MCFLTLCGCLDKLSVLSGSAVVFDNIYWRRFLMRITYMYDRSCVFLFDFLPNVYGKQLRACRDGQLSKQHFSWRCR